MNNRQILFSENHLLEVSNVLNANFHYLKRLEKFNELEKEMLELSDSIFKHLSKEDREMFEKLTLVQGEMEEFTNALVYSLGIKYGVELKNL